MADSAAQPSPLASLVGRRTDVSVGRDETLSGLMQGVDGSMNVALKDATLATGEHVEWAFVAGGNVRFVGVVQS